MKRRFWTIAACTFVAMVATQAAAQEIRICNDGESELSYALVATSSLINLGNPDWTAHGWYVMKPGECQRATWGDGQREAFLSLRAKGEKGLIKLKDYKIKDIPTNVDQDSVVSGAERLFCVSDKAFQRQEQSLEAHEQCPDDYHLQVFNVYLFSRGLVKFTAHLE
jgi:hypothetical protein